MTIEQIATYAGYLAAIAAAVTAIVVPLKKCITALWKPINEIKLQNEQQSSAIKELRNDVAHLQGDRLNQAYDHYTAQGWCSGSKKRELEEWYQSYHNAGYNHLADHYLDVIMSLPEHPENERTM